MAISPLRAATSRPEGGPARVGVSGTRRAGGAFSEDPNPALQGSGWVDTVAKMHLDARLFSAWRNLKTTLLSADWEFEPVGSSALSAECADWLNGIFGFGDSPGTMAEPFESQLSALLEFVPLGWRYAEVEWEVGEDGEWRPRQIHDCQPSAHHRWLPESGDGFTGVEQLDPNGNRALQAITIPAEKLLHVALDPQGDNLEGRGLYRPCWFFWALKKHTLDQVAIGVERMAAGIPSAQIDRRALMEAGYPEERIDGEGQPNTVRSQIETALADMAAGETSSLVYPTGVQFRVEFNTAFDPERLNAVIDKCNEEMMTVFLSQFLMLGQSGTSGSYALGRTQRDVFVESCKNVLDVIQGAIGGPAGAGTGLAGRMIDLHSRFWRLPAGERPKLRYRNLDPAPFEAFINAAPGLVNAGLLTPDTAIEREVRARFQVADLDEEYERDPRERLARDSISGALARVRGNNGQSG